MVKHVTTALFGYLFDGNGNYIRWVEEGKMWKNDGTFLGEIVQDNYILKR